MNFARLFSELKRRDVFRAGAGYVVAAWLLTQVADILLDTFAAPPWAMRSLVLLLAIGFPVTIVLAWIYEFTTHGVKRTPDMPVDTDGDPGFGRKVDFIIIGVLAVALIASIYRNQVMDAPTSPTLEQSIAVLPFTDFSPDKSEAYFARGIHDDLLTMLSRLPGLRVVSRTSVERIDTSGDIQDIGRRLGVSTVMEGSVQRNANRIRINVQLIDAQTDGHIWAETYDRQLTDVFEVQEEIGRAVVDALKVVLSVESESGFANRPTENMDAYIFALKGSDYLRQPPTPASLNTAESLFERALEEDAQYARAYAGLCGVHLARFQLLGDTSYFERGEQACFRAITFDDRLIEVRIALGNLYQASGQYEKARTEFASAADALPRSAEARVGLAEALVKLGKSDAAEAAYKRAIELEPTGWAAHDALASYLYERERYEEASGYAVRAGELAPDSTASLTQLGAIKYMMNDYEGALNAWKQSVELEPTRAAYTNTGLMHYYLGQFEDAADMQLKSIELAPNDHRAWGRLAESYRFIDGREADADAAYRKAIELAGASAKINANDWYLNAHLALYHAGLGDTASAVRMIEATESLAPTEADVYYYTALAHLIMNDEDGVYDRLERAVELGFSPTMIANDPDLKRLRESSRFSEFMTRVTRE